MLPALSSGYPWHAGCEGEPTGFGLGLVSDLVHVVVRYLVGHLIGSCGPGCLGSYSITLA